MGIDRVYMGIDRDYMGIDRDYMGIKGLYKKDYYKFVLTGFI